MHNKLQINFRLRNLVVIGKLSSLFKVPSKGSRTSLSGRRQYSDIFWWRFELKELIEGYTHVCFMPYAITKEIFETVTSSFPTRTDTMPDCDANGSGDFHPSRNEVVKCNEDLIIRQLVLVSKNNKAEIYGPAVQKDLDPKVDDIQVKRAFVSPSNYYPSFAETNNNDKKQQLLGNIADILKEEGLFKD